MDVFSIEKGLEEARIPKASMGTFCETVRFKKGLLTIDNSNKSASLFSIFPKPNQHFTKLFRSRDHSLCETLSSLQSSSASISNQPPCASIMNIQTPVFQPLRFIPATEKEAILATPILKLLMVTHNKLTGGGNHWCFYLQVSPDCSVHIDITPSYSIPSIVTPGGSKAIIIVSNLTYLCSSHATKTLYINVHPGSKVHDFVHPLVNAKRYQYKFNSKSCDCKY
ncbi:hypothetical protein GX51_08268 [Blastomyces parvus]|uniref:DUF7770 domain-containing protein n=1 Tax=Blastomyces parvus TaxID=2060905 RepID=A0A2B7WFK3_9EURO|nr:hypothetical protein GX51_08268 [Blastomyces parvus]